jgi:hypothetical protein
VRRDDRRGRLGKGGRHSMRVVMGTSSHNLPVGTGLAHGGVSLVDSDATHLFIYTPTHSTVMYTNAALSTVLTDRQKEIRHTQKGM